MKTNVEASVSLWMDTARTSAESPLTRDITTDVCIVGAGIAGLTTAYLLAREGRTVAVLDDGPIAGGQTQRTTAHLSNAIDDRYLEIERIHGQEGAQLAAASHTAAINQIEKDILREGIDCDFLRLDGYLFVPRGESTDILDKELAAARRAGLDDVEIVRRAPIDSFDTGRALKFPRQGQFHPLKYLTGLTRAIEKLGGKIHTDTHVASVEGGTPARVSIKNGPTVTCQAAVVATNTPMNDMFAIHTKQAPYLTYAIGAAVPAGSITRALYWDTLEAYHYVRLQPSENGQDILIIGGEDHKSGQDDDQQERWHSLETWARERFPMITAIKYRWSGMVMETTDGLAFIGRNPGDKENVFIATGDSGMGMTHGTIAGILLTDHIQGRENPWSEIYDPARKPVWGMAWRDYLAENINVAKEYVKDYLGPSDVSSPEEIKPGQGALMRSGLSKVAIYRDEKGNFHRHSAVCPHLGCIVHWNGAEKTWDCPCHGSRFDALGGLIVGPANTPLPKE
jgi:glycine/D-amino acid oxidase-like deaminating enzyme/nitrite reductase/ring-hydroxylating ferredoxin subunit